MSARGAVVVVAFVLVCAAVFTSGAQQLPTGKVEHLTVIGCVMQAPPDTRAAEVPTAPVDMPRYVITNITLAPQGRGADAGSSTAAALAEAVKMYELDTSAGSLLAGHVGDRVRISGTLARAPRPSTTPQSPAPTPAIPMLHVESLDVIDASASSCPH